MNIWNPEKLSSQCPTSFTGLTTGDKSHGSICGFRQIDVAIDLGNLNNFNATLGGIDVEFSSNVEILDVTLWNSNMTYDIDNNVVSINFGLNGNAAVIDDDDYFATISYTLITGITASAETSNTRLAYDTPPVSCGFGSNAAASTLNLSSNVVMGNILIPSQFSCSSGSTDHGLPGRTVTTEMAYDPYWEICEISSTNAYGDYGCSSLRDNCEYNICVTKSNESICGIDEFDIDIILDWILGIECFDYEWQLFAGDVSNDGYVSTTDKLYM
ncbi:MAG TPA: hypothetical protein VFX48_05920, partial [Saprospiraceae bacterium]|nr:hypothetical protein [Saprospiraceae bacterium]